MYKTVGIIGCGAIGTYLFRELENDPEIEISFLYDLDDNRIKSLNPNIGINSLEEVGFREIDLIIETAQSSVIVEYGKYLLERSNLMVFSATSLANEKLYNELVKICIKTGHVLYIPHGAIPGIDGIIDGRRTLKEVNITTIKPPASLGREDKKKTILYEGPTREACTIMPRNVNVHAVLALAGLGFDKTYSRIISDPEAKTNSHLIDVKGAGFSFRIFVESYPLQGVTGKYTPESAYSSVKKVCYGAQGITLV